MQCMQETNKHTNNANMRGGRGIWVCKTVGNTQRTVREHSEQTQRTLGDYSENPHGNTKKHPENTQSTLREHSENKH